MRYLFLVDYTGRVFRDGKAGISPALAGIFDRPDRLTAACSAWNMATGSPEIRRLQLEQYIEEYRRFNPATSASDVADVLKFMESLIERKLAMFPDDKPVLAPELRLEVRDALSAKLDLIESFVDENPAHLSGDELDIVRSWRHLVAGRFCVFRELKKYTVFLTTTDPAIAYGVVGLSQPIEDIIGPYLPVLTQTVLLPFKGKIVYDGLITRYNITYGPGIRRSLNNSFKEAKLQR